MKKILFKIILILGFCLLYSQVFAVNLIDVYQQALKNDPTFKMAYSQWLSYKENVAISRAGLLPSFNIQASYGRSFNNDKSILQKSTYDSNTTAYQLTLQQPIFNYQSWSLLNQAKAVEKQYAAQYSAAAQNLMYRTVYAYFNVLRASDMLYYTRAEKRALSSELNRTRERYKVGLATITAVDQAKASYDGVVAQEIQDRNNLDIQKEKLQEITNKMYESFATLTNRLPLVYPNPRDISAWVKVSQQQNYGLLAARFAVEAAEENIQVQRSNHFPVLNAQGQYQYTNSSNMQGTGMSGHENVGTIGLSLSIPVFEGGGLFAKTRQAQYSYQYANNNLDKVDRSVISGVKQAYLDVIAGISAIKAQKQAVRSARSALKSTKAAYKVGTQTMTDVLDQESNLYNVLKNYANAQYDYLIATVALKQAAGTLSVQDLQKINSWLTGNLHYHYSSRMNSDYYVIQILAVKNSNDILHFMREYKLPKRTVMFHLCKNGRNQYILVIGDYSSVKAAKSAIKKLPKKIQDMSLWIRKYSEIHKMSCQ